MLNSPSELVRLNVYFLSSLEQRGYSEWPMKWSSSTDIYKMMVWAGKGVRPPPPSPHLSPRALYRRWHSNQIPSFSENRTRSDVLSSGWVGVEKQNDPFGRRPVSLEPKWRPKWTGWLEQVVLWTCAILLSRTSVNMLNAIHIKNMQYTTLEFHPPKRTLKLRASLESKTWTNINPNKPDLPNRIY